METHILALAGVGVASRIHDGKHTRAGPLLFRTVGSERRTENLCPKKKKTKQKGEVIFGGHHGEKHGTVHVQTVIFEPLCECPCQKTSGKGAGEGVHIGDDGLDGSSFFLTSLNTDLPIYSSCKKQTHSKN